MRWLVTNLRIVLVVAASGLSAAYAAVQVLPVPGQTPEQQALVNQLIQNARASLARGDLEGTRATLEQVLALQETNEPARLALTDVLMRVGRWVDAEKEAQVLTSQYPADTEPVYLRAAIALRRGDPQNARELAHRCLARGDSRPEIYKVLALAEYSLGQNEGFETHIRVAIEKNRLDAEAQYLLARYLYEVKRYDESLHTFQAVLQIEPERYKARYYAGLLHGANGDKDRAREEYLQAIKIVETKEARYGLPYADLGRHLADAGELDRAVDWLSRGMRNDPACPRVYYEYARALFLGGTETGIEKALLQALRLDPGYTEAYYLLGRYYSKLGNRQFANQALARFKDLKDHPLPSPYGLPRR